jgi:putative phosphoribosyl transferase
MKKLETDIPLTSVMLKADLVIPENANAIVVFEHASGSSRFTPRNRMVAELIQKQNIGTLLFDLLTEKEEKVYQQI